MVMLSIEYEIVVNSNQISCHVQEVKSGSMSLSNYASKQNMFNYVQNAYKVAID